MDLKIMSAPGHLTSLLVAQTLCETILPRLGSRHAPDMFIDRHGKLEKVDWDRG